MDSGFRHDLPKPQESNTSVSILGLMDSGFRPQRPYRGWCRGVVSILGLMDSGFRQTLEKIQNKKILLFQSLV